MNLYDQITATRRSHESNEYDIISSNFQKLVTVN